MFFSLILPVYNRERLLPRCLASLLRQDFADFEIIAVDDGSTDSSLAILQAITDPRLRILAHENNRGVCPARNTAIAAARGQWIVAVDSDDELVEGALSRMHQLAGAAPDSIHALWFRCRMDDGRLSPDPVPTASEWDYRGYIAWLRESRGRWRDMLRCVRRSCFAHVRYPDDRMLEDKFHLDFARRFRSRFHADVLRLYHQDAENSLVKRLHRLDPRGDAALFRDRERGMIALLREHGAMLRSVSPDLYADYLQNVAAAALIGGRRAAALADSLRVIAARPLWPAGWKILAAALLGPKLAFGIRRRLARA
jgi:glycosyltransferase involved in cell wall biosynthesis